MSLLSPYMQGGSQAMSSLTAALGPGGSLTQPFTADMMAQYSPAYAFQLKQGQDAMNAQAAAMGLSGSGGTAKALGRYAMDYSTNAFGTAADIYGKQQQRMYDMLSGTAKIGETAATTAGEAGQQAAEYAGTMGAQAAQWAGQQNINAENLAAGNTLSGANYLANTQIGAQQALAQGDLGAAQAWNGMLGGLGQAGNTLLFGGLGASPGGGFSWSPSNFGPNLFGTGAGGGWGGFGRGSYSPPGGYTPGGPASPWEWG